jgi:tetratricopeptide (TPR) repeat protein
MGDTVVPAFRRLSRRLDVVGGGCGRSPQCASICGMTLIVKAFALLLALSLPAGGDDAYQHYLRAGYFLHTARPQMAANELRKVIEADPQAAAPRVALGRVLLGLNQPDEALTELEKAEQLSPQDPSIPRLIGRISLQIAASGGGKEFADKAEAAFKRALALDSEEQESLFFLSMLYEQTGRLDEAIAAKKRLLELSPSLRDVWLSLANSLREKGDRPGELEALERTIEIDPENPDLLRRAGETAEALRDYAKANDYYARAVGLITQGLADSPNDPTLLLQRADIQLWDTGRYNLVVADCNAVVNSSGDDSELEAQKAEASVVKASALYQMADYQPATEIFQQYEELVLTQLTRSFEDMILSYARSGKVDRALNLLKRLESSGRFPGQSPYFTRMRAQVLDDGGRGGEAEKVLREMISANPQEPQTYLQLTQVLVNGRRYDEAAELLAQGTAQTGEQRGFLFLRGVIEERGGDFEAARKTFTSLVESDPKDHLSLNYLGYMMADRGVELQKAKSYIEQALKLQPYNGSYLDSLGWACFKLGDLKKAEEILTASVRTQYRSAEVREHLGRLYEALGRDAEALDEYRRAIELDLAEVKPTAEVENKITELEGKLGRH